MGSRTIVAHELRTALKGMSSLSLRLGGVSAGSAPAKSQIATGSKTARRFSRVGANSESTSSMSLDLA